MKKVLMLPFAVLVFAGALWAASGWYVVTYQGQAVAGPFSLLSDCNAEAAHLARQYYNVSRICQYR